MAGLLPSSLMPAALDAEIKAVKLVKQLHLRPDALQHEDQVSVQVGEFSCNLSWDSEQQLWRTASCVHVQSQGMARVNKVEPSLVLATGKTAQVTIQLMHGLQQTVHVGTLTVQPSNAAWPSTSQSKPTIPSPRAISAVIPPVHDSLGIVDGRSSNNCARWLSGPVGSLCLPSHTTHATTDDFSTSEIQPSAMDCAHQIPSSQASDLIPSQLTKTHAPQQQPTHTVPRSMDAAEDHDVRKQGSTNSPIHLRIECAGTQLQILHASHTTISSAIMPVIHSWSHQVSGRMGSWTSAKLGAQDQELTTTIQVILDIERLVAVAAQSAGPMHLPLEVQLWQQSTQLDRGRTWLVLNPPSPSLGHNHACTPVQMPSGSLSFATLLQSRRNSPGQKAVPVSRGVKVCASGLGAPDCVLEPSAAAAEGIPAALAFMRLAPCKGTTTGSTPRQAAKHQAAVMPPDKVGNPPARLVHDDVHERAAEPPCLLQLLRDMNINHGSLDAALYAARQAPRTSAQAKQAKQGYSLDGAVQQYDPIGMAKMMSALQQIRISQAGNDSKRSPASQQSVRSNPNHSGSAQELHGLHAAVIDGDVDEHAMPQQQRPGLLDYVNDMLDQALPAQNVNALPRFGMHAMMPHLVVGEPQSVMCDQPPTDHTNLKGSEAFTGALLPQQKAEYDTGMSSNMETYHSADSGYHDIDCHIHQHSLPVNWVTCNFASLQPCCVPEMAPEPLQVIPHLNDGLFKARQDVAFEELTESQLWDNVFSEENTAKTRSDALTLSFLHDPVADGLQGRVRFVQTMSTM